MYQNYQPGSISLIFYRFPKYDCKDQSVRPLAQLDPCCQYILFGKKSIKGLKSNLNGLVKATPDLCIPKLEPLVFSMFIFGQAIHLLWFFFVPLLLLASKLVLLTFENGLRYGWWVAQTRLIRTCCSCLSLIIYLLLITLHLINDFVLLTQRLPNDDLWFLVILFNLGRLALS